MIDLEKILKLEADATPGPWLYDFPGDGLTDQKNRVLFDGYYGYDGELVHAMRNNIRQICLELQAAREYFSKDREVRQISLKDGLQAASNAWQEREDLLQKYYEVKNGKD